MCSEQDKEGERVRWVYERSDEKDEILCDEEIQCGEEKKAADCDLKIKRSSYFIKCTFKTTIFFSRFYIFLGLKLVDNYLTDYGSECFFIDLH